MDILESHFTGGHDILECILLVNVTVLYYRNDQTDKSLLLTNTVIKSIESMWYLYLPNDIHVASNHKQEV